MIRRLSPALLGLAVAIATTSTMDATGYTAFSALPLFPLLGLFWWLQRFRPAEVGFRRGTPRDYGLALLHPFSVIGVLAGLAFATGVVDLSHANWAHTWLNLLSGTLGTFLVVIVTEEGFFRGWLWAALGRAGLDGPRVVLASSLAFALWHVSAVVLPTGFNPPPSEVPVFLVNVVVIGAIWGMLRLRSGSVVVSSAAHGLWNGLDYALFGFGSHHGGLGVRAGGLYGPENGWFGLAANLVFAVLLWRTRSHAPDSGIVAAPREQLQ